MALWLLKPVNDNDKTCWFGGRDDACYGMVVRAEYPAEARQIADENSCQEQERACGWRVWTDAKLTTCEELNPYGESGVICRDISEG